jgi:hypothetical protein
VALASTSCNHVCCLASNQCIFHRTLHNTQYFTFQESQQSDWYTTILVLAQLVDARATRPFPFPYRQKLATSDQLRGQCKKSATRLQLRAPSLCHKNLSGRPLTYPLTPRSMCNKKDMNLCRKMLGLKSLWIVHA